MFRVDFGFAEREQKASQGVGYKLTLTMSRTVAVFNKALEINDARVKDDIFHQYVPHYTPSIPQQGVLSKQILSKTPTELQYIKRSV